MSKQAAQAAWGDWEIKVYSSGGNGPEEPESWDEAMDNAEAQFEGKKTGEMTGDAWIDQNSGAAEAAVAKRKSAVIKGDGGIDSLGKTEPELIRQEETSIQTLFSGLNIIKSPVSYAWLAFIVRNSPSLRQNIEAYARGIDGHGYQLTAVLDMDSEQIDEKIRTAIYMERLHERRVLRYQGETVKVESVKLEISDAEIAQRRKQIEMEMAEEKARIELFFDNANPRETLVRLRQRLRWDLETYGNGYLALMRNPWSEPLNLWHIPARSTRAVKQSQEDLNVEVPQERVKISTVSYDSVKVVRSFRRYVQGVGDNDLPTMPVGHATGVIWFKEIGDPRVIGNRTGTTYRDKAALEAAIKEGKESGPAIEIMHFMLIDAESPVYGLPRWQGQAVGAMGEIEAEQSNLNMLRNDAIPDMIILCEGGRFAAGAVEKIEKHLKTTLKGKNRARGVLTLEAAPAGPGKNSGIVGDAPVPKIHIIPLTQYQREDALYVNYMKRTGEKIDSSFQNPPMAVGKYQGMNRATATVLEAHVEKHIYEPIRREFDDLINLRLMPIFNARYWLYKSNAPVNRDPRELIELCQIAVLAGFITVDEARLLAGDAFSEELPPFESEWSNIPLPVYLAQLKLTAQQVAPGVGPQGQQEGGEGHRAVGKALEGLFAKRAAGAVTRDDVNQLLDELRADMVERLSQMSKQAALMGMDEQVLREALSRASSGEGETIEISSSLLKEWVLEGGTGRSLRTLPTLREL